MTINELDWIKVFLGKNSCTRKGLVLCRAEEVCARRKYCVQGGSGVCREEVLCARRKCCGKGGHFMCREELLFAVMLCCSFTLGVHVLCAGRK